MLVDVNRGQSVTERIDFVLEECYKCGIPFLIPRSHQKRLVNTKELFYCPNGHGQCYSGPSEADRLKKQLEEEKAKHNREMECRTNELLDAISEKNKLARKLKRVEKGMCPCCNRSFPNLQRHIQSKHPEMVK